MSLAVTGIILTLDEAINIGDCLASLGELDEVILVDSGSTDSTLDVARRFRPDVRVLTNRFEDFGQQRNWALDHADPRNEWVLFVDADERITPDCASVIRSAVESARDEVGFFLCYRNWFMGRWIRHATLFPSWQLRLLKRGYVRYVKDGHGQKEVANGPLGYIRTPYDHLWDSKGLEEWIARHNRYSTEEASRLVASGAGMLDIRDLITVDPVRRRRALKAMAGRMPMTPVLRFLYSYVLRGGFLDGREGLTYCLLIMAHRIHILAKVEELRRRRERTGRC